MISRTPIQPSHPPASSHVNSHAGNRCLYIVLTWSLLKPLTSQRRYPNTVYAVTWTAAQIENYIRHIPCVADATSSATLGYRDAVFKCLQTMTSTKTRAGCRSENTAFLSQRRGPTQCLHSVAFNIAFHMPRRLSYLETGHHCQANPHPSLDRSSARRYIVAFDALALHFDETCLHGLCELICSCWPLFGCAIGTLSDPPLRA